MKNFWFLRFSKMCIFGIFAVALFSFILMHLWNWLIPYIFNGPSINFWQSGGLLILSKILFSGFGRRCAHCQEKQKGGFWRQKFDEKMGKMTPEEKARFRERFKGCWSESMFNKQTDSNQPG
jgi:hypothetical protein